MRMEPPEERLIELDARSYSEYEESDSIANFTIFSTAQPPIITTEITSFRQAAFSIPAAEREPAHVLPLHSPPPHADSPARNDDASAGTTYTLAKASTTKCPTVKIRCTACWRNSIPAGKPGRIVDFFTAAGMHPKDWTSNHIHT